MTVEEIFRRLALQDESAVQRVLAMRLDSADASCQQQRMQSVARLGALIAMDATTVSYQSAVPAALAAGLTVDEVLGALIAVAPLVGLARVTSAAVAISAALGHDLDEAFERIDRAAADRS